MYLSKKQALEVFLKLKPADANRGKVAKEKTSSLFRFLAFDHLCKKQGVDSIQFSSDRDDPTYKNRQKLVDAYADIGALQDEKGEEVVIDYFGMFDFELGRSAKDKIGNDFLTAQLKQAQDTQDGKDYPHRPSPLLFLGGSNTWLIKKHSEYQKNLPAFIGPPNSINWSYLAQFIFRKSSDSLENSIKGYFTENLANHWIGSLQKKFLIKGSGSEPVSDADIVAEMRLKVESAKPTVKILSSETSESNYEDLLKPFKISLLDSGLRIDKALVINLVSSLNSKPFLILTGLSGSGKTKLAQAFSQWITPAPDEGESNPYVALIPVGADWMGNENILGYPNGLNDKGYISKPALELILHAENNEDIPHFLILDEMNLSHVERYFADLLSAIESGEEISLHSDKERKAGDLEIPSKLTLPKNLFVIGTVNVDETTYMFSPKVLDRANVIEFRMNEKDLGEFLRKPVKPDLKKLAGHGFSYAKAFVEASQNQVEVPLGVAEIYKEEMLKFFKVLAEDGAEYGFRVAHEAARFMYFYQVLGGHDAEKVVWFDRAFDAVIIQKFLPKLHGSSNKLGGLLQKLWVLCLKASEEDDAKPLEISVANAKDENKMRYPKSAQKIARMHKILSDNGFASFAEA